MPRSVQRWHSRVEPVSGRKQRGLGVKEGALKAERGEASVTSPFITLKCSSGRIPAQKTHQKGNNPRMKVSKSISVRELVLVEFVYLSKNPHRYTVKRNLCLRLCALRRQK